MVRPEVPQTLNAAPHYIKATELYIKPDGDIKYIAGRPGCKLEPGERGKLLDWMNRLSPRLVDSVMAKYV